jgi:hypothetical protein
MFARQVSVVLIKARKPFVCCQAENQCSVWVSKLESGCDFVPLSWVLLLLLV